MIIARSLMSVTFLEVHFASVGPAGERDGDEVNIAAPASSSALEFKTGNYSPLSLEDDIFDFLVDPAKHMLFGDLFREAYEDPEEYHPAPVIVIRSRSHRYLMIREQSGCEVGCAILVESLESRLNDYARKKALEHPHVLESLLNELRQLIELSKKSVNTVDCTGCFFTRLFDASLRLKDEYLATTILKDVLILWELKELFYCSCEIRDYNIKPAISFANLIRFSKGWSSFPDLMKQLTNQMLADENANYVSEIALHLLKSDDLKGASETFQLLLEAVENSLSTPGEMEKIFHAGLVSLALRLHEEEPNQKALDTLLHLIKHIEPSQFAKLAKTMSEWITKESLDCKRFLNELGSVAIANQFRKFTPQQFLKTVEAFRSSDMPEFVQQSWKIICSRCIEIDDSKEASECLLCDLLREPKSDEDRQQTTADPTEVDEDQTAAVLEKHVRDILFYAARHGKLDTIKLIVNKLRKASVISNTNNSDMAAGVEFLFGKEANSGEPSLEKFPTIWEAFKKLCSSLHAKWESTDNERKVIRQREELCVSLMQCFLWIGDEKGIAEVCSLINQVQRSEKELADVHSAIIREKRTMELAMCSPHGILAINNLIDERIEILNTRLKYSATEIWSVSSNSAKSFRYVGPPNKCIKLGSRSYVEIIEQLKWQKEVDELQALRRSHSGQSAGPSSRT